MRHELHSHLRTGLIALGLLAGLSVPAAAGPAGFVAPPAQSGASGFDVTKVASCRGRSRCRMGGIYARNGVGRSGNWNGNRRYYNNSWNGNGHYRRHYRRHRYNNYYNNHYNDYYNGAGIFLGLGALGLGYGLGYYNNYPYYNNNYYNNYAPRRVYRTQGLSQDHYDWCYNRWLSYRDSDNTYQPNYGGRRQCVSPYG